MPLNVCPKTCNQLTVAAILISVGIVQLLAGIILLKSDDIYLLAGTDFVVAVSNILIGCLLGIAASVWEKKKKVFSLKNTARHNVLAGLYMASLSMNATAAIVMILGDGNKLLTTKDSTKYSGDLVFELLACAYVTSVCSPIVCFVISLVCLSGNRIRIYENMKKKNSLTRKESYGWVFENNQDNRSKNGAIKDPSVRNASVSDDNVFVEKSVTEKKSSKKNKERNSSSSLSELKSPLEIWAHKRNKIIEEITSPKPIFFADDYLQFPEFKYGSYIGTLIPRISQTSFIKKSSNTKQTTQAENTKNLEQKIAKVEKTMSCKPSKPHLDELNYKLASRRMSYPESGFNNQLECSEKNLNTLSKTTIEDSIADPDTQTSQPRSQTNSVESQLKHEGCFNFEVVDSPLTEGHDAINSINSSDCLDPYSLRRNSNESSSSGLTAETISELKAKINKMNLDDVESAEDKPEFFRSFKHGGKRKSHLSESDIEEQRSEFQKLHNQYGVFSQNSESESQTALAGEIIPISIRQTAINRADSIPLKTICSQAPSRYSEVNITDQELGTNSDNTEPFINGESRSNFRTNFSSSYKENSTSQSNIESNSTSSKCSERRFDFKRRMSTMGSIAESPTEEFLQIAQLPKSAKQIDELSNSSSGENKVTDSPKNGIRHLRNSNSLRRLTLKAAPSLLNRLWSVKRTDAKTDLSSLVMDSDSLVGLSDDDLMARSRRLRQLRKTVELRSKTEKPDHAV